MGSFTQAMDASQPARTLGENGAPELTAHGVGDARVALFAGLTRNCASLDALWDAAVREANGDAAILADLVVLAFQTRDCRGGKGERALFTKLFCLLIAIAPEAAAATVALVPEYGSWRDLCVLYDFLGDASNLRDAARARAEELRNEIVDVFARQLRADLAGAAKPSLAAKYAPREHKQHQALSGKLAAALFPGDGRRREKYRKAVANLSRALDVPEIKMCGKRWADLDVAAVPSRCLAKSRKAFLNEALKGGALSKAREATGDRFPEDADRVACREHVREAALATAGKKLKGAQLFPHEIVNRVCRGLSSTLGPASRRRRTKPGAPRTPRRWSGPRGASSRWPWRCASRRRARRRPCAPRRRRSTRPGRARGRARCLRRRRRPRPRGPRVRGPRPGPRPRRRRGSRAAPCGTP